MKSSTLKEVNSIPKEYRQSKLSSRDWRDNSSGLSNCGHQVYLHITAEDGLTKIPSCF
jgi:hypothetical protein